MAGVVIGINLKMDVVENPGPHIVPRTGNSQGIPMLTNS
jgi:hypothetical protein